MDASLPLVMRWSLPSAMYALFRRRFGGLGPATAAEVAARSTAERLEGMRLEPTGAMLAAMWPKPSPFDSKTYMGRVYFSLGRKCRLHSVCIL